METKFCKSGNQCVNPNGPEHPDTVEFFPPSKSGSGIPGHYCRACYRAKYRAYNKKSRSTGNRRAPTTEQREQHNRANKIWYENNPGYSAKYKKERMAHDPEFAATVRLERRVSQAKRRALGMGKWHRWKKTDIKAMLSAQNGQCWWCGKKLEKYHVDHRIPLSRGGSNDLDNLCLACPRCNESKKDKLPHEWNGRLL